MKIIPLYFFLCLSIIFTTPLYSKTTVLSLNTFVQNSLSTHPLVSSYSSTYYSQLYKNKAAQDIYDSNFFLNTYYTKGSINTFSGEFNQDAKTLSSQIGLSKRFASTGSEFTIIANHSRQLNNGAIPLGQAAIPFPDTYISVISLALKKSLYKNFTGNIDQYPLEMSKLDKKLSKIIYTADLEAFIGVLTETYLNWRHHFIRTQILSKQLKNTQKQVVLMSKQFKRGTTEKRELLQAKQQSKQQELLLITEKERLNAITHHIFYLMTGKQSPPPLNFIPENRPYIFTQNLVKNSIKDQSSIQLMTLQLSLSKLSKDLAKEQQKQQIDLVGEINQIGIGNTQTNSVDSITDNRQYRIGLEIAFPILGHYAKHKYEEYNAKEDALNYELSSIENELQTSQFQLYQSLKILKNSSKQAQTLINLSKDLVKEEIKAYKQGRLPSFSVVIQAQNQILNARLLSETIQHQKLLTKHRISLIENDYQRFYQLQDFK